MRTAGARRGAVLTVALAALISAAATLLGGPASGLLPAPPARAADYPRRDSGYHSYREMTRHLRSLARARPDIVRVFSIGRTHEGRRILIAEVSDDPGVDEGEPEVLFDGLHHAREHLSAEMAIDLLDMLVSRYGQDTKLGRRVTRVVDSRRIWIIPMVDPDGLEWDLSGGASYRNWRKNRQPTPGSSSIGTDLNRNWGYRWGCCGASSGNPASDFFRGRARWSAPEVRAVRDFVLSRVVDGRQRIRAHVSFHTAGEMVLWPYGHTRTDVPPDMTRLDRRALVGLGRAMAAKNGYLAQQSSAMYLTDGDMIDWMYARQRIFSYTFELYPRGGTARQRHYPPDEIIGRETRRNNGALLLLMERADCPYRVLGPEAEARWCGPFFDDLEIARGWRVDPDGTDSAGGGRWARGVPRVDGVQVGHAFDGQAVLATGLAAGRDVDGGTTTVRSPHFRLPSGGGASLTLRYAVALGPNATAADGLRVHLVDESGARVAQLLEVSGDGSAREARWLTLRAPIPGELTGSRIAVELEAVDAGADSLVEAAVDQVRVTLEPSVGRTTAGDAAGTLAGRRDRAMLAFGP